MRLTARQLQTLLHAHILAGWAPLTEPQREDVRVLLHYDLIMPVPTPDEYTCYTSTLRGQAHVKQMQRLSMPTLETRQCWVDANGDTIE